MPQAFIGFVAKIGAAIVTGLEAVGFSTAVAVGILDVGIKLAGLAALNALYEKFFLPDLGSSAESFTVTIRGTIEHQRIIYGETIASGLIWYINTAGTHNQSLYYGIALTGHEINDITDMWIDDYEIPDAAIDWGGNGSVDSGDFRGDTSEQHVLYFEKKLGLSNQVVNTNLDTAFTEINSSHRGQGIAWFLARLDYFKKQTQVWSSGAPNHIKGVVQGKKVYDPRLDDTQPFGSGAHRVNSAGTWEWSRNPALCWADYMIDADLGFGEDSSRIDYAYVASAATVCDGVVFTPVGTDVRFACDGILSTGDTYETNIKRILSSMNGGQALINGQWKVRAWGWETPTLQFGDDDLRDDLQIQLDPRENERYNTVRATFIDKDRLWKSSQAPEFTSSEYVSRDNDVKLYKDVTFHMTKETYMAQRLEAGILEQSDNEVTVVYPTNFKTLPAEINGTIMVSNTKMGWVDKDFRVERYKFKDLGGIDLVLREDGPDRYADVATNEYTVASNGQYTIADPGVPPPSSIWVNPRIDGNLLHVTPPAARLYEEIIWYVSPTSAWTDAEELVRVKDDDFFHKLDRPRPQYYFSSALNFAGEESDRIPNSDYTDIFATPDVLGTRPDSTFDLSDDVDDFWETTGDPSINTTAGESGEHTMRIDKTAAEGAQNFRAKAKYPIQADEAIFRFRYNISSFSGVETSTVIITAGFNTFHPSPVSSDKFITNPSTYTQVAGASSFETLSNLTADGNWHTFEHRFPMTNAINSGATLCSPSITVTYSDTVVRNNYYLLMDFNWMNWYWV